MLVEMGLLEQRHKAVLEVLNGASVTDVARRYGVARQTLHDWLRRYARGGMAALRDRSSKPATCPHQMSPEVEARICALRREHPGWGPQTIRHRLGQESVFPLPSRSAVYRALVRHHLIEPSKRRRSRSDYKRWERSRPMELWQMDIVGGVKLTDGTEASVVTGIDDHSRFCVSAKVVARATARPVCDALAEAMRRHGVPERLLTDNGKVFTGRFGINPTAEVLFDRICRENGIRHYLTAPYSPTTTGKVERFHKTLRAGCLTGKVFNSIEAAQAAIDAWVATYNNERPHQSIGMVTPAIRFALANTKDSAPPAEPAPEPKPPRPTPAPEPGKGLGVTRWVDQAGRIGLGGFKYHVGRWLAGEIVEILAHDGLLTIAHQGVVVATRAQRFRPGKFGTCWTHRVRFLGDTSFGTCTTPRNPRSGFFAAFGWWASPSHRPRRSPLLVEMGLLEQRHKAVLEVLNGASVTDVARRYGVVRQTLHDWLRRYARGSMAALRDRSSRPATCRHQIPPRLKARVCALRREHPAGDPRPSATASARRTSPPFPSRSAVYRALVRHRLIEPSKRRRQRGDYKRWERSRPMELWQMDVVGGVKLADGTEASVVTGIDDHSRFCVSAEVVARATARPVCDALAEAMRRHGVPERLLTDNGKVFTGRFCLNPSVEVLFDRICRETENGIRHHLNAPYSPTTTSKVERFHKTLRAGCLTGKVFDSIDDAQGAIDAWVATYNTQRPHQAIGMVAPSERFALANQKDVASPADPSHQPRPAKAAPGPSSARAWVSPASSRRTGQWEVATQAAADPSLGSAGIGIRREPANWWSLPTIRSPKSGRTPWQSSDLCMRAGRPDRHPIRP